MSTLKKSEQDKMFAMVKQCQASTITTKAFCKIHHIKEHVYYYWQHKYRLQAVPAKLIPLEVSHTPDAISGDISLTYPNGVCMELSGSTNLSMLKELIQII